MTEQYKGKVFKAGNSAAVRLPKDVAFALGTEITVERTGDTVTIRPAVNPEAVRTRNQRLAEALRAAWADAPYREVEVREPDIFPDRPGLY
jgi:antitoxin VapB